VVSEIQVNYIDNKRACLRSPNRGLGWRWGLALMPFAYRVVSNSYKDFD